MKLSGRIYGCISKIFVQGSLIVFFFRATNQTSYLDQARAYQNDQSYLSENPKIFNIDTKVAGNQLLLALEEDPDKTESFDQIATFCDWYDSVLIKTTRGLAYPTKTKATGPAASSSFVCGLAALRLQDRDHLNLITIFRPNQN